MSLEDEHYAQHQSGPPPLGLTTTARVVSVHDGDTIRVAITRVVDVRLQDVWAPEMSQPGGREARDYLRSLIDGREVHLHVPGSERGRIGDVLTFGRAVGTVWLPEAKHSINEVMVKAKLATRERVATKAE